MKPKHSLILATNDRGFHARQVDALEELLLAKPPAVLLRIYTDSGTPPSYALTYAEILRHAQARSTRIIACAYTDLHAADVLVWLSAEMHFLLRPVCVHLPSSLRPEARGSDHHVGTMVDTSDPQRMQDAAYSRVLKAIEQHVEVESVVDRILNAPQCETLGLSTGTLDQQIVQAMTKPPCGKGLEGRGL